MIWLPLLVNVRYYTHVQFRNSYLLFFRHLKKKMKLPWTTVVPVGLTNSLSHHSDKLQVWQVQTMHQHHDCGNRLPAEEECRQQPLRLGPHGQRVHPALQQPGLQCWPAGDFTADPMTKVSVNVKIWSRFQTTCPLSLSDCSWPSVSLISCLVCW